MHRHSAILFALAAGASLAGCSSDSGILGSNFTTSALNGSTPPTQTAVAAPKIDPACVALTARIDALRRDGVAERVEKASVGKSSTVAVKRASLAQMTELDKANAEFQSRCSTLGPRPAAAAQATTTQPTATAAATTSPASTSAISAKSTAPAAVAPITPSQPVTKQ